MGEWLASGLQNLFWNFAEFSLYLLQIMIMKLCSKCKTEKCLSEFRTNKTREDGYQKYCVSCDKEYQRDWYEKNKQKVRNKSKISNLKSRKRNQKFILEYLANHPCVHCGELDPIVLDFDHLRDKELGVGTLISTSSLERIKKEISKCQVLCSNCHRKKTAKDFGWYKTAM